MAADIDIVIGAQDKATAVINNVAGKVSGFSSKFAALGPVALGVGAAIASTVGSFLALDSAMNAVNEAAAKIDENAKAAASLQTSIGDLQAFQFALGEFSGVGPEAARKALSGLQKAVGDAVSGDKGKVDLFKQIGIDANKLSLKGPVDQFMEVKNALASVENASQKASIAQKLIGKAGKEVISAIVSESAAFESSMDAARNLGVTISSEGAAGVEAMNDSIGRVKAGFEGVISQVTVALAPAIETAAIAIATWLPPIIEVAVTYLPTIVDSLVVGSGYAYDIANALFKITTYDLKGALDVFANMDTGEQWLKNVQDTRQRAVDAAEKNAARLSQISDAAIEENDAEAEAEKRRADAAAKTIEQLERKLAVQKLGEDAVRKSEELATATNDVERERIQLLQDQFEEQKRINDLVKQQAKDAEDAAKAMEKQAEDKAKEDQKIAEDKAKEAEDLAKKFSEFRPGTQAVESRVLTRGPSEKGIDKIASSSEKQVAFLKRIADILGQPQTSSGLQLVEVG